MKATLKSLVLRGGMTAGRRVDDAKVAALLAKLHPVLVNKPLIRIGADGDGAYLVPDDLDGIEACFSPGVDVTAAFESDLVARGIRCFLADASVRAAPIAGPMVDFEPKFVGVVDEGDFMTLDSWVSAKLPSRGGRDLLLQMDIEGGEWPVLLNMSSALLKSFRIIVLELHHLHKVFEPFAHMMIGATLERLAADFHVAHSHPNNAWPSWKVGALDVPPLLEVTFVRKDRVRVTGAARTFPHPLDVINVPALPPMVLPACLHS